MKIQKPQKHQIHKSHKQKSWPAYPQILIYKTKKLIVISRLDNFIKRPKKYKATNSHKIHFHFMYRKSSKQLVAQDQQEIVEAEYQQKLLRLNISLQNMKI